LDNRQRYLAAARRQPVDRIPTHFRGSRVLVRRLMAHFGIDPAAGVAAQEALLSCLGADFMASGSRADALATYLPLYTGPAPGPPYLADASYFYTLGIPSVPASVDEAGFVYPVYVAPPLAGAGRASDIPPGYLTRRLADFDFDVMVHRQTGARLAAGEAPPEHDRAAGGRHVVCMGVLNNLFMICSYLRGMEQFLVDLVTDQPLAERLAGEVEEFCLEFNRRYLLAFGSQADACFGWDDVAGQDGMLFSPALFRRLFQPIYRDLITEVKRYGLVFSWHCCGSAHQVLPLMVDAGIDVFDVVQTSARDMDLATIRERYAPYVAISGGIDVQKLLVSGTPTEVAGEVRRARDLWGLAGGLVLGPSHEAAPETPLENVLAIYAT
jgi:uroporphyrinogen decarboxylase